MRTLKYFTCGLALCLAPGVVWSATTPAPTAAATPVSLAPTTNCVNDTSFSFPADPSFTAAKLTAYSAPIPAPNLLANKQLEMIFPEFTTYPDLTRVGTGASAVYKSTRVCVTKPSTAAGAAPVLKLTYGPDGKLLGTKTAPNLTTAVAGQLTTSQPTNPRYKWIVAQKGSAGKQKILVAF